MKPAPFYCGWCLGAPSCAEGTDAAHGRCSGQYGCVCAAEGHAPSEATAQRMAGYCAIGLADVYYWHEHQRSVSGEEGDGAK